MDPSKGLFRRRPSTASTRSRTRGQPSSSSASASPSISGAGVANVIAANIAQSCPTSPSHSSATRRSIGGQKIPEDEETHNPPTTVTTTTKTQINNTTTTTTTNNSNTTHNTLNITTTTSTTTVALSPLIATASSSKEAAEYAAAINDAKREREALQKSPPAARMRNPRVSSAGSRLVSGTAKARAAANATMAAQQNELERINTNNCGCVGGSVGGGGCGGAGQTQLHRSASTVSGISVRPYSSPAGLHAYTGKIPGSVPSSVHGSRVDLRDPDKGSAIYLGCSAPRNSTLSLSSRTSSGSSAPPSPVRTPPVSPRHGVRRAATMVKRQQQQQQR